MKWSNQKPPRLDAILGRGQSPHAIAGTALALVDAQADKKLAAALSCVAQETSALYIHIPFCPSRCLSCDHLTIIEHDRSAMDSYLAALHLELAMMADAMSGSLDVDRVHIGGGSPNYLDDIQLVSLMDSVHAAFNVTADAQISMEINPRRTSRSQLDLLMGLGIRHLQLEVRDVDPTVQSELGRTQSFSLLEDVFSVARDMKFDSVNMDLLFGLPGQTSSSIKSSIAMIAELAPDMLVCQQFTRRPQQFPHQAALDESSLPSLGEKLAIFNAVVDEFESAGYEWVGLNAFVQPGHPLGAAQKDNTLSYTPLGYSASERQRILGAGLGAVSEVGELVAQNHIDRDAWLRAIEGRTLPTQFLIEASEFELARKSVMRRLMCNVDVPVANVPAEPQISAFLESLENQGYTQQSGEVVSLTSLGRLALPHFWSDSSPRQRWL